MSRTLKFERGIRSVYLPACQAFMAAWAPYRYTGEIAGELYMRDIINTLNVNGEIAPGARTLRDIVFGYRDMHNIQASRTLNLMFPLIGMSDADIIAAIVPLSVANRHPERIAIFHAEAIRAGFSLAIGHIIAQHKQIDS